MVATNVTMRLGRAALRRIDRLAAQRRYPRWSQAVQDPNGQEGSSVRILHEFPHPGEERTWRALLARGDWPTICVAPEFFAECCTGERPFAVIAMERGDICAILTGWREGNTIVSGLSCRPHVCVDRAAEYSRATAALARGLLAEAGSCPLITVYAWTPMEVLQRLGFHTRELRGTVVLDLRRGAEALFQELHANRRRNVRRAMKKGIEVFQASADEDLAEYYGVYRRWRHTHSKKIHGPLIPFPAFAKGYKRGDHRRLFVARHAGRIIAGLAVHFSRGGLLENVESASLDECLDLRPNDLLIWKTVEWGCAQGFSRYSMTGAHPFFQRMGGTVIPVYRHRLDRTWLHRHDRKEILEERGWMALMGDIIRGIVGHPGGRDEQARSQSVRVDQAGRG